MQGRTVEFPISAGFTTEQFDRPYLAARAQQLARAASDAATAAMFNPNRHQQASVANTAKQNTTIDETGDPRNLPPIEGGKKHFVFSQKVDETALRRAHAKPVQGRRVHSDGSISVTLVNKHAPRNLWVRIFRNRADFLAGRTHATNWTRRGCQLWSERPDARDTLEQVGDEIHERIYRQGRIEYMYYRTAAHFERGAFYSMRSGLSGPPRIYNADWDGDEMNRHVPLIERMAAWEACGR